MIIATLCYLQKDDNILMIYPKNKKDTRYNDKWNGVGGKLQKGESPLECAIREIMEETGYIASNLKLMGILSFPKMSKGQDWHVFVYLVKEFRGSEKASKEGKIKWFKRNEVLSLNLWQGDYIFLPYLFRNKFFTGKFAYKRNRLFEYDLQVID